MASVARRVATGSSLALAVVLSFWLDAWIGGALVTWLVAFGACLVAGWELDRMGSLRGQGLGLRVTVSSSACSALLMGWTGQSHTFQGVVWSGCSLLACAVTLLALIGPGGWLPRLVTAWLVLPLLALVVVDIAWGTSGLVALVLLCKIGDNAGYFVGRAFGRHCPFKRLSPGKTIEGCVASLLAGMLGGVAVVYLGLLPEGRWGLAGGALAGAIVNVAAQGGDLSESWFKRRAGVKDSSHLLGASGGLLDVLDSLLLGVPGALVAWPLLFEGPAS
jgi:CDP-diglyceride synthetase